jgi:hypothetical protein
VNVLRLRPCAGLKGRLPNLPKGRKMKEDEVKQITNKALEELVSAL